MINLISYYRTVTPNNLYSSFDTVKDYFGFYDFPFTTAMSTWELQKGFPMIHVHSDHPFRFFAITQERYYASSEERVLNDRRSWYIPLTFATESNPNFEDTHPSNYFIDNLPEATTYISYPEFFDSDNQWFIFNIQQIGFYRVNYDTSNWNALIAVLNSNNFNQIHVLNRAQLIDDSLNLATDMYLDYRLALQIFSYLSRETDYIPWQAAADNLDELDYILKGSTTTYNNFRAFVRRNLRRMHLAYGWDEKSDDSLMDKFARELAIDWLCRMGDQRCLSETYLRMQQIALEHQRVPASLELTFICNGLRGLNRQDEFVALWQRMQASHDQTERLRIIDGLLCASDPKPLLDLLETTLINSANTNYRNHEIQRIVNNAYHRSSVGITVTIDFLLKFTEDFMYR